VTDQSCALVGLSAQIFEQAMHRTGALRGELQRLERTCAEREDLPGTLVLLRALGLIVGEAEREIVREARTLAERGQSGRGEQSFRRSVGGLVTTLDRLVPEHLARAKRTHGREVEALVGPFTRLANTLSPNRELIFDPVDRYEIVFSSVQHSLRTYAQLFSDELRDAIDALPHVTIVSYPSLSESDTLQHALLGHEIAHLALTESMHPGDPPIGSLVFNQAFAENLAALRLEVPGQTASERLKQEVERHGRLQNWFFELACDLVGTRLVGPALVLALSDLAAVRNRWSQHSDLPGYDTHPGLAWRLKNLLPEARRFLDLPRFTEPWESARTVLDQLEASVPDESDDITPVERTIIDTALRLLKERIDTHLGDRQLLVGELERLFDPTWEKLQHFIPPAEEIFARTRPDTARANPPRARAAFDGIIKRLTGSRNVDPQGPREGPWSQPIDWRIVLNVGAFFFAAGKVEHSVELRELPLSRDKLAARNRWNGYLRGTVELGELQYRLQEVKDELDVMNFPS
jgi:hypothetical protein